MFDLDLVYSVMLAAVDEACDKEDYRVATAKAIEIGMSEAKNNQSFSLRKDYFAKNSEADYVRFHFRSYDQSQAFSIRPDMNKLELELIEGGKTKRSHQNKYED